MRKEMFPPILIANRIPATQPTVKIGPSGRVQHSAANKTAGTIHVPFDALPAIRVPRIRCAFDREAFSTVLASLPAEPREALAVLVAPAPPPTPAEPSP